LKLGRTLDAAYTDGGDLWCPALAQAVCTPAGLDLRVHHLDTTGCSLSGASVPEREAQALTLTAGDAKAHRPAWKQVVVARMGAHAGGVPCGSQRWDGTTAAIEVCQARAQALLAAVQHAPSPRYRIADAPLDPADKAPNLHHRGLSTRMPPPMGVVSPVIAPARTWDPGHRRDDHTRAPGLALCHDGRAHRWCIVPSEAALERAEATMTTARPREAEAVEQPRCPRQATRFKTPAVAHEALAAWATRGLYPQVDSATLRAPPRDAGHGRPTPRTPRNASAWHIPARVRPEQEAMRPHQHVKACVVLGPQSGASALRAAEVLAADQGQSRVAGGCRLLQDPRCLVASLLVTQPRRMAGLLMVRTLTWLVSSVAPRRMRQHWARHHATVPTHRNQPLTAPT
jgi:hypothetical protein